jgi:ubiquinol-cytochrome c reductase cytochrome c subunit
MVHGPGQMPVFDWPAEDRDAVATYVEYLGTAAEPGGLAIGGIGPVPEGLVAWIVGMALLAAIVYLVGRRWDRTGHRT